MVTTLGIAGRADLFARPSTGHKNVMHLERTMQMRISALGTLYIVCGTDVRFQQTLHWTERRQHRSTTWC